MRCWISKFVFSFLCEVYRCCRSILLQNPPCSPIPPKNREQKAPNTRVACYITCNSGDKNKNNSCGKAGSYSGSKKDKMNHLVWLRCCFHDSLLQLPASWCSQVGTSFGADWTHRASSVWLSAHTIICSDTLPQSPVNNALGCSCGPSWFLLYATARLASKKTLDPLKYPHDRGARTCWRLLSAWTFIYTLWHLMAEVWKNTTSRLAISIKCKRNPQRNSGFKRWGVVEFTACRQLLLMGLKEPIDLSIPKGSNSNL